jgi:hypothetical protein
MLSPQNGWGGGAAQSAGQLPLFSDPAQVPFPQLSWQIVPLQVLLSPHD